MPDNFFVREVKLPQNVAIAIEGGGSTSILLLGQLKYIREKLSWNVFAYSGASAGAIIAALHWSGLSPTQIEARLITLAESRGLSHILWSDINPFSKRTLPAMGTILHSAMAITFNVALLSLFGLAKTTKLIWHLLLKTTTRKTRLKWAWRSPILSKLPFMDWRLPGRVFIDVLDKWIREGLASQGIHEELLTFAGCKKWVSFRDVERAIALIDGFQQIESLEDGLIEMAKAQGYLKDHQLPKIRFYRDGETGEKRNNILDVMFSRETAKYGYVAPMWISITDLENQRELVVNNFEDEGLKNIPIAKLVRASAGHPAVFRNYWLEAYAEAGKRRLLRRIVRNLSRIIRFKASKVRKRARRLPRTILKARRRFLTTDGGIILNFPIGVFGSGMRRRLKQHKRYHYIANMPYATVGLRWIYPPGRTTLPLAKLILGGARTRLEDHISEGMQRHFSLRQVKHRAIPGILEFDRFTPETIRKVVRLGEMYARLRLKGVEQFMRIDACDLESHKKAIVDAAEDISHLWHIKPGGEEFVRLSLFVEAEGERGSLERCLGYCPQREMVGAPERFYPLESEPAGLVGLSMHFRRPVVGRLDRIMELRKTEGSYVGVTERGSEGLPEGLRVAIAVPLFDFVGIGLASEPPLGPRHRDPKDTFKILESAVRGPCVGVLAVGIALNLADRHMDKLASELCESFESRLTVSRLERLGVTMSHIMAERSQRFL